MKEDLAHFSAEVSKQKRNPSTTMGKEGVVLELSIWLSRPTFHLLSAPEGQTPGTAFMTPAMFEPCLAREGRE